MIVTKKIGFTLVAILTALIILSLANPSMAVTSRTYTLDADFDEGTLVGVEHETVHNQLQLSNNSTTLPFIWVPNSNEGTVSKYDTLTGKELARYRTGPTDGGNPSRTTVDLNGNAWVGNRDTGTVVKIGLFENGQWVDKDGDGEADTSRDANDDGKITGSEVLPWGQDECVLYEVLLGYSGSGPRGMAIDSNNNLWVGTYNFSEENRLNNKFYHLDGENGSILNNDTILIREYGSYGAVVDGKGNIWSSSGPVTNFILKIDPKTKSITPISLKTPTTPGRTYLPYGLGIDKNDHLFVSVWDANLIFKIDVNTGDILASAPQGDNFSKGVAVTNDGDVWIVNSQNGDITRLDNDLTWKATIDIGADGWEATSTGVAVDEAGKIWTCNYNDGYLHRINPSTNSIDFSVQTPGLSGSGVAKHYGYSDMTGIISRTITTKIGTWTVNFDSEAENMPWESVSWNSNEPSGTFVAVEVRSSNDGSTWSAWEKAANGNSLNSTPAGRYLQVKTTLQIMSGDVSPNLNDLTVRVGNKPPVANAGVDQVVEQANLAGASVTLNGSGSTDDGLITPLTYIWTWNCGSANGVSPTILLPFGTTQVTLNVSDGQFSATDTVDITVKDTTPPTITTSSKPIILWPANHKYKTVSVSDFVTSVTDICDAGVGINNIEITSVSSDEPDDALGEGDGNTVQDIVIEDSQKVDLRAERQGDGNGRVYTINYKVTDASGNIAIGSFQVWVPHDQAGGVAIDDGAAAGYIVNYS